MESEGVTWTRPPSPPRTDFAAQVPQLERAVVAARHDAGVVQQEAGRQNLPAVARQGVLQSHTEQVTRPASLDSSPLLGSWRR